MTARLNHSPRRLSTMRTAPLELTRDTGTSAGKGRFIGAAIATILMAMPICFAAGYYVYVVYPWLAGVLS